MISQEQMAEELRELYDQIMNEEKDRLRAQKRQEKKLQEKYNAICSAANETARLLVPYFGENAVRTAEKLTVGLSGLIITEILLDGAKVWLQAEGQEVALYSSGIKCHAERFELTDSQAALELTMSIMHQKLSKKALIEKRYLEGLCEKETVTA